MKKIFGVVMLSMVGLLYSADGQWTAEDARAEVYAVMCDSTFSTSEKFQAMKNINNAVQQRISWLPTNDRNRMLFLDVQSRLIGPAIKKLRGASR